jgi:hypothetical protein
VRCIVADKRPGLDIRFPDPVERLKEYASLLCPIHPDLTSAIDQVLERLDGYEKGWTAKVGCEAEDLRREVERVLEDEIICNEMCPSGLIPAEALRKMLDQVDARDSVRWLEEREEVIRNETREQVCALLLGMTVVVGTDAIPMSSNHVLAAQGVLRLAIDRIEKMAKKPQKERWGTEDVMLYPGQRDAPRERRRSFRCECGSNVFRKSLDMPLHYRCNGCDATYTGEGYSDGPADPVAP